MADKPTAAVRKRQQIGHANKLMLLWIAGISVIVGISIVLIVFLVQKIWYGEKVIGEKDRTAKILEDNLKAVEPLRDNIRVLNTNEDLKTTRTDEGGAPIQSVLDALPADANSTALASSLQTKLLAGVPGIIVETINVEPVGGIETINGDSFGSSGANTVTGEINFTFSVSADSTNYNALRQVLERLERSIRAFNVTGLTTEGQGNRVIMTVRGVSYYDQAKTIQLSEKVVQP